MFKKIKDKAFEPLSDIIDGDIDSIENNIIAAREALVEYSVGNRPASSRFYQPHNHADGGGVNIAHGLVGGFDLGRFFTELANYNNVICHYGKGWSDYESDRFLMALIKYESTVSGTFKFPENEEWKVKQTSGIEYASVVFRVRGTSQYASHTLSISGDFRINDAAKDWVRVYAFQLYETSEHTVTTTSPRTSVGNVTETPHVAPIDADLYTVGDWVSADRIKRWGQNLQALYEATYDLTAEGMTSQTIKGHDHDVSGGIKVAMNYVGGLGTATRGYLPHQNYVIPLFSSQDTGTANVWFYADQNPPVKYHRRTNGTPGGTKTTEPHFLVYSNMSWGIPSHLGYAVIAATCDTSLSFTLHATLYNITVGSYSGAVVMKRDQTIGERTVAVFTDVPLASGWNEFAIEYAIDVTGVYVDTLEAMVFEVPSHDGTWVSRITPTGTRRL